MADTKFKSKFTFWLLGDQVKSQKEENEQAFDEKLKPIVSFGSTKEFWEIFQYLKKPSQFEGEIDIYLFREGIKPLWQDPKNEKGGYFTIKIGKGNSNKVWENAVLACITPNKQIANCINGVRLKSKDEVDIIQVWMNGDAHENLLQLKQYLKDSLQITDDKVFAFFHFSYHLKSLKGNKGFQKGRK